MAQTLNKQNEKTAARLGEELAAANGRINSLEAEMAACKATLDQALAEVNRGGDVETRGEAGRPCLTPEAYCPAPPSRLSNPTMTSPRPQLKIKVNSNKSLEERLQSLVSRARATRARPRVACARRSIPHLLSGQGVRAAQQGVGGGADRARVSPQGVGYRRT